MQNDDEAFSENAHNSYTAPYILIKSCILIHFFKKKMAGKMTEKRKKRKKNIDQARIRTTVCQAIGLQESLLDHSVITCCVLPGNGY